MFAEDPAIFLADFGVPATWYAAPWIVDRSGTATLDSSKFGASGVTTQTALVLLDQPDSDVIGNKAQSRSYKITFPATQFVGVKYQDAFVIDGVQFAVRTPNSLDDGAWFSADLEAI